MTGADNMARDEAILSAVSEGRAAPTLRLYAWEPPCLSLGYGQRVRDVDLDRLTARGWDLVRRPTGGKAILHADELTYSVALPIEHELAAGGVIESYRRISEALLVALQSLGAQVQADPKAESAEMGVACFDTPSHYEVTANGKKLVGSAQVRRRSGVLQHGTLPLSGDIARICDVLHYEDETTRERAKVQVQARATTLEAILPASEEAEWYTAAKAVVLGFERTFGTRLDVGMLTEEEQEQAEQLARQVYGSEEWTMRR